MPRSVHAMMAQFRDARRSMTATAFRFRIRAKIRATLRQAGGWPLLGLAAKGDRVTIARPRRIDGRESIRIGDDGLILKDCWIQALSYYAGEQYQPAIVIGKNFYAAPRFTATTVSRIDIGDDVTMSTDVYLVGTEHGIVEGNVTMGSALVPRAPIVIGSGCFIGAGAKILPGVVLGPGCRVGANAVVTRSFPAGSVIGGVPAQLIRSLSSDESPLH